MSNVIDFEKKKARKSFDNMYSKFVDCEESNVLDFMQITDCAVDFYIFQILKLDTDDKQYAEKRDKDDIYNMLNDVQEAYLKKYVFKD